MKDKNLPNDYNSLSLEELTKEANKMIKDLESQKNLENSIENYQNLLKLNNIIEKKFQKDVKNINEKTRENISKVISNERALSLIKSPIMTEKSTNLNQFNKYSFFVSKKSNSNEIKQAIENIFKVKVIKINTLINRGKLKSFKGSLGYKKDQKKAIVTLSEGNTIDSSLEIK